MQIDHDPLQDWIKRWWPVGPLSSQEELEKFIRHILQDERAHMRQVVEAMKIEHADGRNSVLDEVIHRLTNH